MTDRVADRDAGLAAGLEALLAAEGVTGRVTGLRRLSGGASRETYAFDVAGAGATRPLILQRQRPGTLSTGPGMAGEAALLRSAHAAGVPVPTVVAEDDGTRVGGAAIVTERLDGETIARKLLRDERWATARRRLTEQAGAALAAIHRMPPAAVPSLREVDGLDEARSLLASLDVPSPAFELGLRWLEARRPPARGRAVVHGDFRLGNLLVGEDGLEGVLDWELAHLGDPVEDLGWYCVRAWRFGSPLPAGGTGTREDLLAAYEAAGGPRIDGDELRWWEVLGTIRWGLICLVQAQAHLSGAARSVELAAIGRRVAENEWDVLGLLPGPAPLEGPAPVRDEAPSLYGRPTAGELVEAVREWVDGDVREATEGRVAFHARVAANALQVVERELALGPEHRRAHAERLERLGCADDADLADRIRRGALDDRAEEVHREVAAAVRAKLEVANPRWLVPDG